MAARAGWVPLHYRALLGGLALHGKDYSSEGVLGENHIAKLEAIGV